VPDARQILARVPLSDLVSLVANPLSGPGQVLAPDGRPMRMVLDEQRSPTVGPALQPYLPTGAEPRAFVPFPGWNLNVTPRSELRRLTPFQVLRNLADSCDPARICIEDLKSQLAGFAWDVREREEVKGRRPADVAFAKKFFERPDRQNDFGTWLRILLEDTLVLDAPAIYFWRDLAGDPYGLLILDGATIKPLVDDLGLSPDPPENAYQQIVYGRPEIGFTKPYGVAGRLGSQGEPRVELLYAPRCRRSWTPYGQSPLERFLVTISLILRRQMRYLSYYTDGSVPDAFWKVPETWTPETIERWQKLFDTMIAGEPEQLAKLRFMPGGGLELPRGQDQWTHEFEEFLWRVASWAFGVSPLPVVMMMNRATAQQAEQAAVDSGVKPLLKWVRSIATYVLDVFLGMPHLEFVTTSEKEETATVKHERRRDWLDRHVLTIDEVREEEGLDAVGFDRPIMETPSGPLPLSPELLAEMESDWLAGGGTPGAETTLAPTPPAAGGPQQRAAAALAAAPSLKAARAELRNWRRVAESELRAGRAPGGRSFRCRHVRGPLKAALDLWIGQARTAEDVRWGFDVLAKADRPLVSARRRLRLERKMRRASVAHFRSTVRSMARSVSAWYGAQLGAVETAKAATPPDDVIDVPMEWDSFRQDLEPVLGEAFLDGEVLAQKAGEVEVEFGLTEEAATEYARARGAELVGKRVLPDGSVVDNPNPKWAISQTVRDHVRTVVSDAFDKGWTERQLSDAITGPSFWINRSDLIARTETAFALNSGALDTYEGAGLEEVDVIDGTGCLPDGHNEAVAGVDGERWTTEKAREHRIGHPNCRRDFAPVVPGASPSSLS
jgi:hypothetical protein